MKKLQIIVIVFLISFSICTFASMQAKACTTYTYTAGISPTITDAGLTGVSYTITFTDTGSSDMGSGTITIPTGYTAVSLTSVTASGGQSWSESVSSSTISFTASSCCNRISTGKTVTMVFSATNPSSAGSYTWKTTAYSCTCESGTPFTISGSQPTVTVNSALVAPTVSASKGTVDQGQTSVLSSTAVTTGTSPYTYQWMEKAPSGSYVDVGTNSLSYNFVTTGSTLTGVWSFKLQVTDSDPAVVTSNVVTVTVNIAPTVSVSPTSWIMDVGQSKIFSATASGGSGSYSSYQWYVGGVSQSGAATSTFSYSPVSSGSYLITVTVTDSLGATSAQSPAATVTVNASPIVVITPVDPIALDVDQSLTLTAAPTGGSGTITYQWYLDGSAVSGATSSTYVFSESAGSYTVTCTVTDSAFVPVTSASNAVSVTVNPIPVYQVTFSSSGLNADASGNLVSYSVNGGAPSTLGVSGGSISVDSGATVTYSFVNPVTSTNAGEQYRLGSVTDPASVSTTAVSGASTVTGNYVTQYQVSFTQTGITSDAGSNTVLTLGEVAYAWNTLPSSAWVDSGTTFSWSSPVAGVTGEQFVYTGASGLTSPITSLGKDTAAYNTQYQVTFVVSPSGSGSTSPAGTNVWENSGSLSITATPNAGYTFSSWSSNTGSIAFNKATSASATATICGTGTITATSAINTYTITVTQSANGVIAPGTSTVNYGATPSFTITPNTGYHIASITADGAAVTVTTPSGQSYQFSAVSADGSLTATFAINTYTITVIQGAYGVISPGTSTVNYGGSQTFTITPLTGYYIASLTVDDSPATVASSYAFNNVQAPHTITATFAITSTTQTVSTTPTPTASSPTPTPKGSSASPTPKGSSPTPTGSSASPTPKGSSASPTPKGSSPSPTPLYVVLIAVIAVAAIILISVGIALKRSRRKLDESLSSPKTSV